MATKAFNKMNKTELVAAIKALKLEDKVAEIANDPEAPTNAEYVTVLEDYKKAQDEINSDVVEELAAEEVESDVDGDEAKILKEGKKATTADKVAYNEIMTRVIVTDHDSSMVIEDDEQTRTFPVGYGNTIIGAKTCNVRLDGSPQYLPNAVIKRLGELTMTKHLKDAKGNPIAKKQDRFKVTEVEGLSQDELDALKEVQRTRM